MTQEEINEEHEHLLLESKYYHSKLNRVAKKFLDASIKFEKALLEEIEQLHEDDRELIKSILNSEKALSQEQHKKDLKKKKEKDATGDKSNLKKAFRDIAMKSHPDRLVDEENDDEKTKKEALFKKAQSSMDKGDISELIEVAKELNVEPPEPDEYQLDLLRNKIKKIQDEIKTYKHSVAWDWNSANDSKKPGIIVKYMIYLVENHKGRT